MPTEDGRRLESLRNQMEQTKAIYEALKQEHELTVARMSGDAMPLDGGPTQALRMYHHALEAYRSATKTYVEFLLQQQSAGDHDKSGSARSMTAR
jgi:hypothetical protein